MRTRFAPAPTGALHLGHVVNALCVWDTARSLGGGVLLRIEDHDRERCRAEYEAAILDDLDWLGFTPDIHPTAAFRAGRCDGRQSDRDAIYRDAAARLAANGLLYGCTCSRQDLARAGTPGSEGEMRYPGTCRDRGLPLSDAVGWRLRIEPGVETFDDLRRGPQAQDPATQCGDVLVRDRRGNWTYQFVASVDDFAQEITHVIRGKDLLASTGRQIRIARLLGRETPALFSHHGLVMKTAGQKLSKSDRDTGIADLRRAGWSAATLVDRARHLLLEAERGGQAMQP